MKNILLSAALILGAASAAHAGQNPVITGVPVVITTSITITPPSVNTDGFRGGVPVFFVVTPPSVPGGGFTFRLVNNQ